MWLLLVPVCLVIFSSPLTSASEPHYLITIPTNLAQGTDDKACVTFLDLKGAVDLKLELKKDDQVHPIAEHKITTHDHSECYTFKVPAIIETYSVWSLHVTAHGDHINVDESKKVVILFQDMCLIQTDKFVYKPGDTVKFQVITMDRNHHAADKILPLVEIMDANNQRIAQWRDVSTNHGFAEFSFHLANELSLGEYSINLPALGKKSFKVEEYEPQRFEVHINTPSYVAPVDKSFHLDVCGRYTYGKPVEGTMDLSICPKQHSTISFGLWNRQVVSDSEELSNGEDEGDNCINIQKVKTDSKGCISKDINLEFFNFTKSVHRQFLEIKSTLTEDQTGHSETASAKVNRYMHKTITFLEDVQFYQKGLPYRCKIKVTDDKDQPVPNIAVYLHIDRHYRTKPLKSIVTDENGIAHVTVNTSTWNSVMTATATLSSSEDDDEDDDNRYSLSHTRIIPFYSQSESHLTIDRPSNKVECDSDQTVTVVYDINRKALDSDTDHLHVFYLLRSITGIVLYKEHKVDIKDQSNNPTIHGSFSINFHIEAHMLPYAALLVFSVLPNGETVATFAPYEVPVCAKEKVQLKFSEEQVHPGASVNLEVSASPGSLCSIRSVDKGYLLKHPEDRSLLSDLSEKITESMQRLINALVGEEEYSERRTQACPENGIAETEHRSKVETGALFEAVHLKIITNTQIWIPVKCVNPEFTARSGTKVKKTDHKGKKRPAHFTRSYFPDTWLFELHNVGSDGRSVLNLTTPHSITNWVTDAFCLGKTGFAVVKNVELTTFQPYFIDMIVPYSVVQGEKFTIQAVVFSYVKKCLLIVVSLPKSEDLASVKNKEQARCVCEGHSHSFTYDVTAVKPKTLKIHVDSGSLEVDGKCTEDPVLIGNDQRHDSVEKTIIVKSRGHEEEKTQTFLIYPSESKQEIHITLNKPERLVPDSERVHIIILGDLLANVAANLGDLLHLPDGCGEQNLAKIFTLVSTLDYLESTQELTPDKKADMIEALGKGYQKQLTYRSDTGSYGYFAGDDANIWVTALVIKAFTANQKWIYTDENHIQEAVNWLQTVQLPNGCFSVQGYHFNNQLEADNEVTRTAFILTALIEHPRAYNGSIVEDALNCLRKSADNDRSVYTQALLAYAFTLSGDHEQRDQILMKLDEKAIKKEGSKHWETNTDHNGEVETASYVLLALLSDKTPTTTMKRLGESADIIRWLVSQQNPYGGFRSTQDTTIALHALAKYSHATKHMKGDSTVTIRSKSGFERTVHVEKSNSLLVQTVDLPEMPGDYTVSVTGDGLVYLQSHVHYNTLPDPSERDHFSLNVSTEPSVCTHESQEKFNVRLDVRYSGKRQNTNMAVILFEPLSGYIPDKKSIKKLLKNPVVKKTEVSAKKVSIYLDKLTHETESLVFSLEQEANVENLQPATATVYDYYDPIEHSAVEYSAPCSAVLAHCDVSADERADCGHAAISREECEKKGCCFNSSVHESKRCFFKGFKKIENH